MATQAIDATFQSYLCPKLRIFAFTGMHLNKRETDMIVCECV